MVPSVAVLVTVIAAPAPVTISVSPTVSSVAAKLPDSATSPVTVRLSASPAPLTTCQDQVPPAMVTMLLAPGATMAVPPTVVSRQFEAVPQAPPLVPQL
jgi:hypothetical protein